MKGELKVVQQIQTGDGKGEWCVYQVVRRLKGGIDKHVCIAFSHNSKPQIVCCGLITVPKRHVPRHCSPRCEEEERGELVSSNL